MRPLKIKNIGSIHRATRPLCSVISEAGNQGAPWQPSTRPSALRGSQSVSEASWIGTGDWGLGGDAQIITSFEKFTPNSSSNYKRRLGAQVRANRET